MERVLNSKCNLNSPQSVVLSCAWPEVGIYLDGVLVCSTDDVFVSDGQRVDTGSLALEDMNHLQTLQIPHLTRSRECTIHTHTHTHTHTHGQCVEEHANCLPLHTSY